MAYIGLRKPIIGKRTGEGKYGEPFAMGKAIALQVTPNYAEGGLNGDDYQIEYDKEFNYAEVNLGTSEIPVIAHQDMFGHVVEEGENAVTMNANDESNYVGMGWISVEKNNNEKYFTGNFLCKAKFSEPSEDYETKGDSITYKTPSISGRALAEENGEWKKVKKFKTEAEALAYIYEQFGYENKKLTVKSTASATVVGNTKLTVTPTKEGANVYYYKTGKTISLIPQYNEVCNEKTGWKKWDGTAEVAATNGDELVMVEVTAESNKARGTGKVTVQSKTA